MIERFANRQVDRMASTENNWRSRIAVDAAIHHGKPCIAGTRVSVSVIVGSIAEGDSVEDILKSYPQLNSEDVIAAQNCSEAK